ncbi:sugar kinase [Ktedonosporobacter rubrisoli]|uniref:Sugar kinase n=1 Tax=Ktedonosporobacter rubrisoli TaxID=2509675 RepID=A0A4P6JWQ9_KTERU|nr:sugar kinase [Ktedonosporobacter rubrisoli]QBD80158.1 sugar kinase [Ktedonosporobacter rubrisoli]
MDIISFGETMLRLCAAPGLRLETTPHFVVYVGGTESNTLACLARMQLQATWLSALPASPVGRHIETELRHHGVDTSQVIWSEQDSRLGIYYSEEAPAPLGTQVYYDRANSACALLDPAAVDYTLVDKARLLHLTGITPALSANAREVCRRLMARAQAQQIPLVFDVNYRAKLWPASEAANAIEDACRQASIVFCTRADAAELWGISGEPEAVLRQMAARFSAGESAKTIVLTLGDAGSAQLQNDIYTTEAAIQTEGTARFGSGDAFAAGYLYAYLEGPLYRELRERYPLSPLTFGNAFAALKRCIAGDIAVITPEDVRGVLLRHEGLRFR